MNIKAKTVIDLLLCWYDAHARVLPWRAPHGRTQDPYKVWLSEIMLQQTTVPAVIPYFLKFTEKYPDIRALAAARTEDIMHDWAGLGYYSRARNLHACAKTVATAMDGQFPADTEALKKLPGIGDYTAGAIAAMGFGKRATVIDGNVERVITRLSGIEAPLPQSKPEIRISAEGVYQAAANTRPSDLPQAFMDLGSGICTPKRPLCTSCPLERLCIAKKRGLQDDLPRRSRPKDKPARQGWVYWITDGQGRTLFEKRPDKGLLGGMTGLPTSEWTAGKTDPAHIDGFEGADTGMHVRHVFTHFNLTLRIVTRSMTAAPEGYTWKYPADAGLPTVFKKVVKLLQAA